MMTVQPEQDPKLELLLADSIRQQAEAAVSNYHAAREKMEEELLDQAVVLAKFYLMANPHIVKFGFETTEGEFNDNGYDGYSINDDPICQYAPDLHLPEITIDWPTRTQNPTGEYFCTHADHPNCDSPLAPGEWDWDRSQVSTDKDELQYAIVLILSATADMLSDKYGTGILYFDSEGMHAAS